MSHYSEQNAKLKSLGIHQVLPSEEPLKVEEVEDFEDCGDDIRKVTNYKKKSSQKTWSVCKWFCVVLVLLLSSFLLIVLMAGTYGYMWASRQVKQLTAEPGVQMHLPIHYIPAEDMVVITDRAKLFYDLMQAGEVPKEDLSITADEINGFIAHSDFLRGNAHVTIPEDGRFILEMSLPTTGLPGGKGRYFLSALSLEITASEEGPSGGALVTSQLLTPYPIYGLEDPLYFVQFLLYRLSSEGTDDNNLVANIQSGKFLNYSVPDDYIATKENLFDYYDADAEADADEDCMKFMKFLNGIQNVSIKDGAIAVHARRDGADTSESLSAQNVTIAANGGVRALHRLSKFFF